jgi:hypothetical protein
MKVEDIIIAFLLLVVLCLVFRSSRSEFKSEIPGKTVWLLWLQGWDSAPKLVQQVKESWEKYNPEWNIELVDSKNLKTYIDVSYLDDVPTDAAKSDVIRLHLLAKHGGVWADSTMLCMASLDNWIYDAVRPVGFWMWHGRDNGAASWFIISQVQSTLIQKWKNACDDYWSKNSDIGNYFWMNGLFNDLVKNDSDFKSEWEKVPYVYCEDPNESHMLAGKVNNFDENIQKILKTNPPYALKLSRHDFEEDKSDTNGNFAIQLALDGIEFKKHEMKFTTNGDELGSENFVVVAAECGAENDARDLNEFCIEKKLKLIVFDKCNFCKHIPHDIYCRPLKNVGRDAETIINFIITNYDNLPQKIALVPTPIEKHRRMDRFKNIINSIDSINYCEHADGALGDQADFTLDTYEGVDLLKAEIRPFRKWYEENVGKWDHSLKVCWNCLFVTSKENILKTYKSVYEKIHNQLQAGNNLEVVHYVERSIAGLF